ncbi:hypothetical protein ACFVZ3_42045 [Kitasatospora purpeofusca]|uniref:hypothetical protein n=1 Tax=Kitasatospora purpeofusca TaxID=67352 RepID=UPI003660EBEC|nr:hypothetical protein KPHV_19300 [Kitasatospora purpeofusca]
MPKPDGHLYRAASDRPSLEPAVHEEAAGPRATIGGTVERRRTRTPGRPDRATTGGSAAHA